MSAKQSKTNYYDLFVPKYPIPRGLKHYDKNNGVGRLHVWVFSGTTVMKECWVKELDGLRHMLKQECRLVLVSCLGGDLWVKICQKINYWRVNRAQGFHPNFGVKEQKCPTAYTIRNEALEPQFRKLSTFSESVELLSRNRDPNMAQNEHVYATCCRPEISGDVISCENVKTIEGYVLLNFGTACISSFR